MTGEVMKFNKEDLTKLQIALLVILAVALASAAYLKALMNGEIIYAPLRRQNLNKD
jgi:hypothetical protein